MTHERYKKKFGKTKPVDVVHRRLQEEDVHVNKMNKLDPPKAKPCISLPDIAELTDRQSRIVADECANTHCEVEEVPQIRPRAFTKDDYVVPDGYEAVFFNSMGTNTALFFPIEVEPEPIKELTRWQKIQTLPTKLLRWSRSKTVKAYKMVEAAASPVANFLRSLYLKAKTLLTPKRK